MTISNAPADGLTLRWRGWLTREYLALAVVVIAAFAIRLIALGSFPHALNADEAENATDVIRLLTGRPPDGGIFGFDWKPQPAFDMYLLSLFVRVFGENIFAIRLPSALFSTLTLIPFYLLLRRHISVAGSLATTFLLSTQLWYLHFSRNAWDNIYVCLYLTAGIAVLLRGIDQIIALDRPRPVDWWPFGAAGICAALGLYGYFSGRLIPIILIAVALIQIWHHREHWRRIAQGTALMVVVALLLFAPMVPAISGDWELFNRRTANVLLTNQPEFQADPVDALRKQVGRNLIILWNGRVSDQPYYFPRGEPWLDLPTRLLVLGGMLLTFRGVVARSRPERWMWWAWLGIGWLATQLLTTGTPDAARGLIFLPALIAFAAFGIDWAIAWIRARQHAPLLLPLGACIIAWMGFNQVQHYNSWQSDATMLDTIYPYVLADEFPAWAEATRARALTTEPRMSISEWRESQVQAGPVLTPPPETALPRPTPAVAIPTGPWPQPTLIVGQSGELHEPRSVGFGSDGLIYVLDSAADAQTVNVFDMAGNRVRQWGGKGNPEDAGRFVQAWALTTDQAGAIYVLDAETGWVHVFDTQGNLLRRWGGPDARLYFPRAMSTGPDGNIYIADTGGQRVVVFSPDGSQLHVYGNFADGATLKEPSGMAVAPDGTIVIGDAAQGMMPRFTPDNQRIGSWESPVSVAADGPRLVTGADGSIYLTLPEQCQVARMTPDGQVIGSFGSCEQPELLQRPSGIASAPDGRLAVTDIRSARVLIFPAG